MAIKYPDRIESNNPQAYGIVKATEIAGQRLVKQLSDLYKLPDAILSESKTGEDAEGLIWIVGKDLYQLISWQNRNDASGWLKVIPFNEKMFDRFYNLDGNMINSLTGYIKATELLNLLENDSLLNALGKLEYKADLTYDLVTSVYEGVHTIEELREMLKILEEIQNSSEVLNSYLSKYLPLVGGIMSGSIDMNKNSLKNAGFEVVTALPTTNLFNGRQVTYEGKLYTYNNEWNCIADDLGGKPETHEENFVYQPTAADLSIKDGFADIKKLKGNTIVWNQKVVDYEINNSRYITKNITIIDYSNNSFVLKSEAGKNSQFIYSLKNKTIIGHKLFIKFDLKTSDTVYWSNIQHDSNGNFIGSSEGTLPISVQKDTFTAVKLLKTVGTLLYNNQTLVKGAGFGIYIPNNKGTEVYVKNINIFDLTLMFGEGNEPATVEEFEAMFPNDYYEYNEGELMSFDGKGVKSVGFNLFDKTKVESNSYLYSTTGISTHVKNLKENVSDFIRVIPSTKYYVKNIISGDHRTTWVYDSNKIPLTIISVPTTNNIDGKFLASMKITIPDNARYIRFSIYDEYLDSACINLVHSGYRNGEYEPYEDYTLSFQDGQTISQLTGRLNGEGESVVIFPEGLRSAGTAYDEIVYDESAGKHKAIKRIGSVDMGTLSWNKYSDITSYYTEISKINNFLKIPDPNKFANILSSEYRTYKYTTLYNDININGISSYNTIIKLNSSSYTDADSFKASLQGQILYYELETPEVYELDFPINTSYEAYDFGTEEVLHNDDSEVRVPMKASIEYGFNAVDMIRGNYFDIQKLKKKAITTDGGVIEGDLRVDNLIASKSVTAPTFIGNLEGRAKNADKADTITQSTTNEINTPILVRNTNNTVTYNPNFTLNKFNEYLPLVGGVMSGNVDMGGNEIKNTNFELVGSFPTKNLYEGRQVTYEGKIYTYHNKKWISTADDLGDLKETLSSEFVFRPTADTHSVKDEFASVKSIKGNTVVWNQRCVISAGNCSITNNSENSYIATPTQTGETLGSGAWSCGWVYFNRKIIAEHKYLIKAKVTRLEKRQDADDFTPERLNVMIGNNYKYFDCNIGESVDVNVIIKASVDGDAHITCNDCILQVDKPQLIDLTQMFGEGNEPATVEEFEKFYSHLPTDYNEGSLLNLNADSIKSTGFNLFDKTKVLFNKYIDKQGLVVNGDIGLSDNVINGVSDWIKVFPNTNYFVKDIISNAAMRYAAYDAEKNYITSLSNNTTHTDENIKLCSKKITTPNNTHYIRFGVSDKHIDSACINLSHNGERDGEYQSYEEHIVNLPIKKYFPDGLKSAGAAYDEIVFDKNIGKYKAIQRIGSVDMGTLNWTYNDGSSNPTSYPYGFFQNSLIVRKPGRKTIKCVKYLENVNFQVDKRIAPALYQSTVYIIDSSYTDVDSLKTSLQGQILYYELAEPIETIIEDYDLVAYKANDWGTEEIISEEPTTPIKADIEYNFDATNEIRNHIFEIKKLNKKIDELTALVESLLTTLNVNYEKVEN